MSPLPEREFALRMSAGYERQVGRVTDRLRQFTEQIEREGRRTSGVKVNHTSAAISVIHELQTMIANLPLDRLLECAKEADDAHREAVAAEKAADDEAELRKLAAGKPVLRTPEQWAAEQGKVIIDPDGWREPGSPPFDQPCTKEEFEARFFKCTIGPLPKDEQS